MDVRVDGERIRLEREKRAWSQDHLAGAAGIGVRTIQRIEATGVASYESVRAIAAALQMSITDLRAGRGPGPSAPRSSEADLPARVDVAAASRLRLPGAARVRFAGRWLAAGCHIDVTRVTLPQVPQVLYAALAVMPSHPHKNALPA